MSISKADLVDADIVDAAELASDGTATYLTVTVVSTTTGTKVVVVNLAADGEGIFNGRDHPAEAGDIVVITGTSGGLGNGTFTVASVTNDTTFVVNEAIGTSTGGSVTFIYPVGAGRVGFDPAGLMNVTSTNVQGALSDLDGAITAGGVTENDFLLEVDPPAPTNDYSNTVVGGKVTVETWKRNFDSSNLKTIDYTYSGILLSQEVRKVYAANGITITAQLTIVYTYSGSRVVSATVTRNI